MSIQLIARELYRIQQKVEDLEIKLSEASGMTKEELKDSLRKAKAEQKRIRRILDGSKDPPPYRVAR